MLSVCTCVGPVSHAGTSSCRGQRGLTPPRCRRSIDALGARVAEAAGAIEVATRLLNVLETEQRESTYKQALVIALLQECISPDSTHRVSLLALADRFIDLYWHQLDPFAGDIVLAQGKGGEPQIPGAVARLKSRSQFKGEWRPGRARTSKAYLRTQRAIAKTIAQMPATHLQHPGGQGGPGDFIFDSSWLWKKLTIRELDAHGWHLDLLPGVRDSLLDVSPLLIPAVQRLWEQDVRRFNRAPGEAPDLAAFLFGEDRIALAPLRDPLRELQSNRCFYCEVVLGADTHIDHVVPWSRCASNDLANLVLTDPGCNSAKSDALPSEEVLASATGRGGLEKIIALTAWACDAPRVLATGRTLLRHAPIGTRVWGKGASWEVLT